MAAQRPLIIGLTGAIASGKSTALDALARLGAATLSTDAVTHELLAEPATLERLTERWGPEVASGGEVDRAKVGEVVFADPVELRWLESLLHPLVGERVARWRQELPAGTELGVVEVPLLFEAGMEAFFDGTLVVRAGEERRAEWVSARGDGSVEERSGRQLTEREKAGRATWVVENDGTPGDLAQKLEALLPDLLAAEGRA